MAYAIGMVFSSKNKLVTAYACLVNIVTLYGKVIVNFEIGKRKTQIVQKLN